MAKKKKVKKSGEKKDKDTAPKSVYPKGTRTSSRPRNISKEMSTEGKEVCENFEITEKGKKKTIKTCGVMPKKHATKKQLEKQNKLLRNTLILLGVLIIIGIVSYFAFNSMQGIEYGDMKFDIVQSGDISFYHTAFPMYKNGMQIGHYNIYLRNNPLKLIRDIDFDGELNMEKVVILESEESFVCGGHGIISVQNMEQIFKGMNIEVGIDPEAGCDDKGRYMFVRMQNGDTTNIEQVGPSCYNLNINNCEILEVTERFMLEVLSQAD